MLSKLSLSALLFSSILSYSTATFAEVVVIVHPDNTNQLDGAAVKRLFLGKEKKFPDGQPASPLNQTVDTATRQMFDEQVLERNSSQIAAYWSKLVFTGKGVPPKEVSGDAEVISSILQDANAIGYVHRDAVTGDVKVIALN